MRNISALACGVVLGSALTVVCLGSRTIVRAAGDQTRFPQLQTDQLNDQQRPLAEKILKVSSVGISGPYKLDAA